MSQVYISGGLQNLQSVLCQRIVYNTCAEIVGWLMTDRRDFLSSLNIEFQLQYEVFGDSWKFSPVEDV